MKHMELSTTWSLGTSASTRLIEPSDELHYSTRLQAACVRAIQAV